MAEHVIRAGVIGDPIKHSRSPVIHRHWLETYGIAGRYDAIHVPAGEAAAFVARLAGAGLAGCNVTVPHKEDVFRALEKLTDTAQRIGAVNTVWLENGTPHGDNTDGYGFVANLDQRAPGWDTGGKATVIGAGGGARAIVDSLLERGYDRVALVNRTLARAEELAAHFGRNVTASGFADMARELEDASLVVNTTTLGMEGTTGHVFDFSMVRDDCLATDIVYTPLMTPFLSAARDRGLATVDGLGMLLHQAVPGFERWFGTRPEVTAQLRRLVLETMGVTEDEDA